MSRSTSAKMESRSQSPRVSESSATAGPSTLKEGETKDEGLGGEGDRWWSPSAPGPVTVENDEFKPEPSPMPKSESSKSSTPAPTSARPKKAGPQLIDDLPVATEAAMATFTELADNHYQYNTLGRSREAMEGMTCDCQYVHGEDDPWVACGDGSDCINRLTQVECLASECKCRKHCKNQRFQRKQYAPIVIVQTEKKGFGLRAEANIPKDGFIYEYVGDVVSHPSFMKRMRDYAQEGIKHFYFMMLQKDEYIDATKRGGIGRFANHSCNPNCYVAKWTVGTRVRMGIFASRAILANEELTFNYNVDRYGHDAQPCYCGEANCVGILGGKTQTDLGGMDDLYLDALGITEEVEKLGLKGTKKKKGKKLDEDYIPDLKPLLEKDIPKLVQAMRQTQSRKVLIKLLTRIKMTEDAPALRQLMRLRGFSVITNVLDDYADDGEIVLMALEAIRHWPLINRNKVDDSKVNVPVEALMSSEDEKIKTAAQALVDHWSTLTTVYKIPKSASTRNLGDDEMHDRPVKRVRYDDDPLYEDPVFMLAPIIVTEKPVVQLPHVPTIPVGEWRADAASFRYRSREDQRKDVAAVIAEATAKAEREKAEAEKRRAEEEAEAAAREKKEQERRERKKLPKPSAEEKEALKEKRLLKLIGVIVVGCLSKHKAEMDHDLFKKHAKELTQVIADKEKRSSSYKEGKLESFSDEKTAKIKKFAKEYIAKILHKLRRAQRDRDRGGGGSGSSSKGPKPLPPPTDSANTSVAGASGTPDSRDDADLADDADADMDLADDALAEIMDVDEPGGSAEPDDAAAAAAADKLTVADPRVRARGKPNPPSGAAIAVS